MGLTLRTEEAWQRYVIGYERNECVLDLEWSAIGGVISTPFGSKGKGCQQPAAAGRMQGKLRVNGEEITVDCPSNRDRSWGPRNFNHSWRSFPRHEWPWFNDGKGFAGNLYMVADIVGDGQGPIEFGPERMLNGWLLKDGVTGSALEGRYLVTERRSDGLPRRVEIEGVDEHRRTFAATGEAVNFLKRPSPPVCSPSAS